MQSGNTRYWICQAIGWGGFALTNTFFAVSFDQVSGDFFSRMGIFVLLGIVFSHVMRLVIIQTGLLQKTLNKQIFIFLLITICFAMLVSLVDVETLNWLDLTKRDEKALYKDRK